MTTTDAASPPRRTHDGEVDPITFSVMMKRFDSIAHEMTLTLERSAWTSILALCRDFSCAIYDAVPQQICMFDAIPVHTTSMRLVIEEISRTFEGQIKDGDVYICNDPYRGNTHVGDVVTAAPVFVDGRHMFWSVVKGHHMDIGAFVPSSVTAASTNIWQEGLQIPPVKLFDGGQRRDDVWDMILSNLRYRELVEGDMLAQLGSNEKGRERLIEFCREYGRDEVQRYVGAIMDYSDRRMADAIRAMPDGVYRGRGWIDSDGTDVQDIPIHVTVTIDGDEVKVALDGTGPQAAGGVNGSIATSIAAGTNPFLYYVDPDIPRNHGCFRHIEVTVPEGTIANPQYPASTSCATIVPSGMIEDAVHRAMASAIPDLVPGGSARCSNVPQFSGVDERDGSAWGVMVFNACGASGATKEAEGWPLMESLAAMGGLKCQAIEQIELLYPMHIEEMSIEPDSMGFGVTNGGPAVRFVARPVAGQMDCITFGDGVANPPHGTLGGTPGTGGGQYVEDRRTGRRRYISASGYVVVGPDEAWVGVASGGGGYGNPLDRDVERVRADVRDGLVTAAAAREVFGVVLSGDRDPRADVPATEALRAELRTNERPTIDPDYPSAGTWAQDRMVEGDVYLINPS